MRRIAVINQKGGVGKTTTTANLGAALAQQGRRVVVVDMDAQANLSLSLNVEAGTDAPSTYTVLSGTTSFAQALRPTSLANLTLMPSNIDLSGAELELASAIGREYLMKDALAQWESETRVAQGRAPADYVIFDCPPSLGLLSINALAAAGEVLITLQTEFLALQGMSKLVEIVQLLRRRLNPELVITGILPCLYDSRLKLAREVLGEIRAYFPDQVFPNPVRSNVRLAEAPSYGKTIFEYAPDSNGASDYRLVAREVIAREARDADLAGLPAFRDVHAASIVHAGNATPKRPPIAPRAARVEVEGHAVTPIEPAAVAIDALAPPEALPDETAQTRSRSTAWTEPGRVLMHDDASASEGVEASPAPSAVRAGEGDVLAHDDLDASARARTPADETTGSFAPGAGGRTAPVEGFPNSPSSESIAPKIRGAANVATNTVEIEAEADSAFASDASLREVVLTPARPETAPERRILRAEDLPSLPPDAFEILTSYVYKR